jgi:acid phosphatase family membrane protein YuiD
VKFAYIIAPAFGWLVAGSLKFVINTIRARQLAWSQIGYGGFPSTHSSIVSTTALLVGLREGFNTSAFAIATTIAWVVILDAVSLRRQIGYQAVAINRLNKEIQDWKPLRERIGHRRIEIIAGVFTGFCCALILNALA